MTTSLISSIVFASIFTATFVGQWALANDEDNSSGLCYTETKLSKLTFTESSRVKLPRSSWDYTFSPVIVSTNRILAITDQKDAITQFSLLDTQTGKFIWMENVSNLKADMGTIGITEVIAGELYFYPGSPAVLLRVNKEKNKVVIERLAFNLGTRNIVAVYDAGLKQSLLYVVSDKGEILRAAYVATPIQFQLINEGIGKVRGSNLLRLADDTLFFITFEGPIAVKYDLVENKIYSGNMTGKHAYAFSTQLKNGNIACLTAGENAVHLSIMNSDLKVVQSKTVSGSSVVGIRVTRVTNETLAFLVDKKLYFWNTRTDSLVNAAGDAGNFHPYSEIRTHQKIADAVMAIKENGSLVAFDALGNQLFSHRITSNFGLLGYSSTAGQLAVVSGLAGQLVSGELYFKDIVKKKIVDCSSAGAIPSNGDAKLIPEQTGAPADSSKDFSDPNQPSKKADEGDKTKKGDGGRTTPYDN